MQDELTPWRLLRAILILPFVALGGLILILFTLAGAQAKRRT